MLDDAGAQAEGDRCETADPTAVQHRETTCSPWFVKTHERVRKESPCHADDRLIVQRPEAPPSAAWIRTCTRTTPRPHSFA